MKHTLNTILKNCAKCPLHQDCEVHRISLASGICKETHDTVEGLARELRERLSKNTQLEKEAVSELWREGARWEINLIRELLGEEV